MVHTAAGYAKELNRRSTMACAASIGPGSTNMLTGAATGHDQPASRPAARVGLLRDAPAGAGAPATRAPVGDRRERQRLLPTVEPFLRPHHPAGAAARVAAGGDARPHRPGRDRHRDPLPAAGHPGGGIRLPGGVLPGARVDDRASPTDSGRDQRCRRPVARGETPVHHRGRRRALLGGVGGAEAS